MTNSAAVFARYSVDAEWLVPHFEKMLYDNAQLVQLYLDAYLVSGDARQAKVVRDILDYVLHDMTHPEGGFIQLRRRQRGARRKVLLLDAGELSKLLAPEEFNVATLIFWNYRTGQFR
jgi:uncharacterized protein YyaL (SSP411 family)